MKRSKGAANIRRILLLWLLLIAAVLPCVSLCEEVLIPEDLVYEDGNIILHKHGERIGPDEWKVTVKATIGEVPIEKRKMEVVFVLDCSGSMAWCTDEAAHEAGSHSHNSSCYTTTTEMTCAQPDHTHTYPDCCSTTACTRGNNPDHWSWLFRWYHNSNDCLEHNDNYYPITCTQHVHTDACYETTRELTCTRDECTHSDDGATACTYKDENGNTVAYKSRLQAAKETISSMVTNLTEDGNDNVIFKYVIFSSANRSYDNGVSKPSNQSTMVVSSFDNVTAEGGTYMYTGIQTGLNQFSDNEYKKVMVVLTDGAANDTSSASTTNYLLNIFKDPEGTDGTVFTVGFAYSNDTLAGIAGNGGSYVHAGSDVELGEIMQDIETSLTAMLEDPMGTAVGFEKTSIQEVQTSGGSITSTEDTIYWHPAEDGTDTVRNTTIEYSYTVQLNDQADMSGGEHGSVPLNKPTYFLYGIKTGDDAPTEMKEALFPIPQAKYAISTVQTKWQADGRDIQPPTEVESIISDYASATYIPAFTQDYRTITPVIPIAGTNDYYRYVGTTVTADGTEISGVDAVDASLPLAYVVIHEYERVASNELAVGGTKTLIGRDFQQGDSFTFTITPVTDGAPMPENGTVTINPSSGTSMAFSFGTISFNTAGTYTYTIQEQEGSLENVIYDTVSRTLVVTAWEEGTGTNKEIVVSYTIDDVENGHITIANRLETGGLKVEKTSVTSHIDKHQDKEFLFLVSVKDVSGRALNGDYEMTRSHGAKQTLTFTNGYAAVRLKAGEHAVIAGLPDGAAYTVTEDAAGGFTVTASGASGSIEANAQRTASFANAYHSAGRYQFIAGKTLEGAVLRQDEFTFSLLDEDRNVAATGKNNEDGSVFLTTLHFTEEDVGTKTYTLVEDAGNVPGYVYDRTAYKVTLTITDNGDGTLAVTDDLNGQKLLFANRYIEGQFTVSKTVEGNIASRNRAFSFRLTMPDMANKTVSVSTDGGSTTETLTLDAWGQTTFTLKHDQSVVFYPVTGSYTLTETDAGSYTASYSVNGGEAEEGNTASGSVDTAGVHVAFVNTLEAVTPTGVHTPLSGAVAGIFLASALIAVVLAERRVARRE